MPQLDLFTGGALSARFTDSRLTHRDRLAQADLQIWAENPVFGSGPSVSRSQRALLSGRASSIAHTEFTRLLSDHGSFGLVAILLLLSICLERFRLANTVEGRALVLGFIGWSVLYMLVNGMRLVAPSLLFGLACVKLRPAGQYYRVREAGVKEE